MKIKKFNDYYEFTLSLKYWLNVKRRMLMEPRVINNKFGIDQTYYYLALSKYRFSFWDVLMECGVKLKKPHSFQFESKSPVQAMVERLGIIDLAYFVDKGIDSEETRIDPESGVVLSRYNEYMATESLNRHNEQLAFFLENEEKQIISKELIDLSKNAIPPFYLDLKIAEEIEEYMNQFNKEFKEILMLNRHYLNWHQEVSYYDFIREGEVYRGNVFIADFIEMTRGADSLLDMHFNILWRAEEYKFQYSLCRYDFMRFCSTLWSDSSYQNSNNPYFERNRIRVFNFFENIKDNVRQVEKQEKHPILKEALKNFVIFVDSDGVKDNFDGGHQYWPLFEY